MAITTNQESSTTTSPTPRYSYHVFLSFRGEDTRKNFTDHLYTALVNAGIRTFRDDDEIRRGENIESELQKAIRESRISLIVFSKDYASSRWCLDELVNILEKRKFSGGGHVVLPVFYSVGPEDVAYQTGSFAVAFARHEEKGEGEWLERVKRWRVALREFAQLEGLVLQNEVDGHEAKFIQKIIKEIGNRLNRSVLSVPSYTVGLESRVSDINRWLHGESCDIGIGVICGLGGVGKTTVAKVAFNSNYDKFEGSCFLANVRETSEQPNGQVYLQRQLFASILKGRKEKIYNPDEGIIRIQDGIREKRVLIVFDDVDNLDQLDTLIGTRNWFCPGSKIIVTTRSEKLLKAHEKHELFKIKELDDDESLKLFSWYAFGQDHPAKGFMEISIGAIHHCGGLPLALQDLGSFLSGRSAEIWRSQLEKLEEVPNSKIRRNIEISYRSLDDYDKKLFLLITSSFIGKDKDYAIKILEELDLHPTIGIQNLMDRALITIDNENKLGMPAFIQDIGKAILRQESPGNVQRIHDVLYARDLSYVSTENYFTDSEVGPNSHTSKKDQCVPQGSTNDVNRLQAQDKSSLRNRNGSLKRSFLGIFNGLPISGVLMKFFPRQRRCT